MSFNLSLAHLTVLDATPPQVVEVARAAGFARVGLRLNPARLGEAPHPMKPGSPMLRETLARLKGLDVVVDDVEIIRIKPDFSVDHYAAVLESAQQLGARLLMVNVDDPDMNRAAQNIGKLADRAQAHRLLVGVEFMMYTAARSLSLARQLVAGSGHSAVHIIIDALHFFRSGASVADLGADVGAGASEILRKHVQINDAPTSRHPGLSAGEEGRAHRLFPGEGELPLAELLKQIDFNAVLSVEAPSAIRSSTMTPSARAQLAYTTTKEFLNQNGYECA